MTLNLPKKSFLKFVTFVIALSSITTLISASLTTNANAADGKYFNPGRIIDDSVFYNSNSMSASQIQSFLSSKVPVCDTSGAQNSEMNNSGVPDYNGNGSIQRWEWGKKKYNQTKFPCLKDYSQSTPTTEAASGLCGGISGGTKSAAAIINEVAKACGINPQVLVVLLQKEQSLITDTWPLTIQYKSATGFDCPDTAPCDPQYAGFYYQVYNAARQFKVYKARPNDYNYIAGRDNRIYWHPNLTRCGSSQVFIQNQATAALYIYTPYRPNAAALNNLYGTGDSCSSYGNRNFWRMFTDWFGPTSVPLVFKTTQSDTAYLFNGNKYYTIPSMSILEAYGFTRSDIGTIPSNMLRLYQNGGVLRNITRIDGSNTIYLIDGGKGLQFPSREMYNSYGYTIDGNEQDLDPLILRKLKIGAVISEIAQAKVDGAIYLIKDGKKNHISTREAYTNLGVPTYASRALSILSQKYMNSIPNSAPIVVGNSFVKNPSNNKYYYWDGSHLQLISSPQAIDLGIVPAYSSPLIDLLPLSNSPTINQTVKNTDDKLYIFNGKGKLEVQLADLANLGLTMNDFVTLPSGFIDKLNVPTLIFLGVFRINNGSTVYLVKSGKSDSFTSPIALSEQGFSFTQVVNLNTRSSSLFPASGKMILAQGQLFRIGSSKTIYIVNSDNSSLAIPSPKLISAYGLDINKVKSYTTLQASLYPSSGDLKYFVKDSLSNIWQIDNGGKKHPVSAGVSDATVFNLNVLSLPTLSNTLLNQFPTQLEVTNLIMVSGQNQVFKIENGYKRAIVSQSAFDSLELSFDNVRIVSYGFSSSIPTGQPIR